MKHVALAAILAVAAPITASAATIPLTLSASDLSATGSGNITSGDPLVFEITSSIAATLSFVVTSSGAYTDMTTVTYVIGNNGTTSAPISFAVQGNAGKPLSSSGAIDFFDVASDGGLTTLTFSANLPSSRVVGVTVTADATPAPVPLPAGVALLGTALAGLGVMKRRRKSA
ncbi:VPLPA-CTERM sorting domain-containing protein [Frigidibacter sp. MR17.24]|uniref:VPLPA-CTERM sorting domain-containing protein n=1 Tax=Frigidibacter sp. MR17.24 TaxID=3127345 RepID=UPI003012AB0A